MSSSIGKEFMKKTTYKFLDASDQEKRMPQPLVEVEYDRTKSLIELPKPHEIKIERINLRQCIENRQSIREYSNKALSLNELSWLLWCTQGIRKDSPRVITLRNVPSAGARHAFETFLLVNRVESLTPGIYRFIATKHKLLEVIIDTNIAEKATKAAYQQSTVKNSAVTFIWVAVSYRMTWRYGERGYRYLFLDAGHVCQNLYLAAENISSGVCAIAAYNDKSFNQLLGLDGEEKFVIYLATVGKRK